MRALIAQKACAASLGDSVVYNVDGYRMLMHCRYRPLCPSL